LAILFQRRRLQLVSVSTCVRLAVALLAGASIQAAIAADPAKYISNIRNAEDLAWLPGTEWVVSSGLQTPGSKESGHLYLINIKSGQAEAVYPAEGANDPNSALSQSCKPPTTFSAHGIGLRLGPNGMHELYVVNDNLVTISTIELFSIDASGHRPKVTWRSCVPMPAHTFANDVVAIPGGGFAVSSIIDPADANYSRTLEQGKNTGYVLEWHIGKGFAKVPGSDTSGTNGIEIDREGRHYFISAWGSHELVRITRGLDPVARVAVKIGMRPDNSAWRWDGRLMIAGQVDTVKHVFDSFLGSDEFSPSPYQVVELDPKTMKVKLLFAESNTNVFSGATTPIHVGDEIWVGSVRNSRIIRYPFK
jgi:hypothetical protein